MVAKTYADLSSAPDVQDGDLLASFRGTGPLKNLTAAQLKNYITTALGDTYAAQNGSNILGANQAAFPNSLTVIQAGTGTSARTIPEVLSDTVSVMSYIPSNLRTAIRARTSTANVTTYVQAAVNDAVTLGRALYVPCGKYNVQDVALPDNLVMIGEDRDTASFVAVANTSEVFVNANQLGTVNVRLESLTINGGRYGVGLTQSSVAYVPANWVFRDVKFVNSTDADVRSNFNMILFVFERVIFNGVGNNGARAFSNVVVIDGTANINSFLWCEFKELPGRAISFQVASEATTIVGCRFEARRPNFFAAYETVFYLSGARAFLVTGSYFEGTHRVILTEINSNDGVTFANSRFSGQETSNLQKEIFNSNGVVALDTNDFNIGSFGAKQAFIRGKSKGLDDSLSWVWGEGKFTLRTPLIPGLVNTTKKPLFTATKGAGSASVNNHVILNVGMILNFVGNDTGGNPAKVRYVRPFCLSGFANNNIAIAYGFEDNGPASGAVVNPQFGLTGAASTTAFEFGAGITITSFDQASMMAEFDFQTLPLPGISPFTVTPVLASGPVGPWT